MIPIMLTASINPNAIYTEHRDIKKRKKEYINSINYYKKFSKVYFLENSGFDFSYDNEFPKDENIIYLSIYNRSDNDWIRGKGYQEFRMIDEFVNRYLKEDSFIKISGRYIFKNFKKLYEEMKTQNRIDNNIIIIDLYKKKRCNTQIFFISKKKYLINLYGCYNDMDDSKNKWAEHIIFRRLILSESYRRFNIMPLTEVISGSTGLLYKNNIIKIFLSNLMRFMSKSKKVII